MAAPSSTSIGRLVSVLGLSPEAAGEFPGIANVVPVGPESDKAGLEQIGGREDGGRGVANMIDRARRAGGTLEIKAEPGGGTCVTVSVPLQHDHAMQRNGTA